MYTKEKQEIADVKPGEMGGGRVSKHIFESKTSQSELRALQAEPLTSVPEECPGLLHHPGLHERIEEIALLHVAAAAAALLLSDVWVVVIEQREETTECWPL